jgi:hypothetical protein
MSTIENLSAVKRQNRNWLLQQPGVQGTDIGEDAQGKPVIRILTANAPEATKQAIRSRLQGVPVEFQETGEITAYER